MFITSRLGFLFILSCRETANYSPKPAHLRFHLRFNQRALVCRCRSAWIISFRPTQIRNHFRWKSKFHLFLWQVSLFIAKKRLSPHCLRSIAHHSSLCLGSISKWKTLWNEKSAKRKREMVEKVFQWKSFWIFRRVFLSTISRFSERLRCGRICSVLQHFERKSSVTA